MTDARLMREIRERTEAATPGPWSAKGLARTLLQADVRTPLSPEQAALDGAFIAHARTDIPFLLSELEKAQSVTAEGCEIILRKQGEINAQIPDYEKELQPGWDGYGGRVPTPEAMHTARCMSLVPGGDGSLQFEIHAGGADVEIWISPEGKITDGHTVRGETIELREALDRYRYAVMWASSDSWDFCQECRDRFEWARSNDLTICEFDDKRQGKASGAFLHCDRALASPIVAKRSVEGDKGE